MIIPTEIMHLWVKIDPPTYLIQHSMHVTFGQEPKKMTTVTSQIYKCMCCDLTSDHINSNICPKRDRRKSYRRQEDIDFYED